MTGIISNQRMIYGERWRNSMSWLKELHDVYDANLDRVGLSEETFNRKSILLPMSHTSQTAHIEVTINEKGDFVDAEVLDKVITLIPATEQSASRAGAAISPYPLHDKLSYVAGDLSKFGGSAKEKNQYNAYISQLEEWAESEHATSSVKAIYNYLSKETLISDLVAKKLIGVDENQSVIQKWTSGLEKEYGEKPVLYTKIASDLFGAFVRFNVYSPTKVLKKIWEDPEQFNAFIQFYNEKLGQDDFCFVTGKKGPITERHANKIRNSGDKAKLISSNDKTWFTFRGRFANSLEAASISYDVSQKAHNALKWLISRQGTNLDGRVFLVWGNEPGSPDEASPLIDSFDLFGMSEPVEQQITSNTLEIYADQVQRAIRGLSADLTMGAKVNILVLDAATPGRMSVQYYRNMEKEQYLKRLEKWHTTCTWRHDYKRNTTSNEFVMFEGAPSPRDIAFAAYGGRANDKIVKELMERLLASIIDGREIPSDIIQKCVQRATNPMAMESWEWRKILSITCAILNYKEGTGVALNTETTNRSYLFGRLLAIANVLEERALYIQNERRQTNAQRLMTAFSNKPMDSWKTIYMGLVPYKARLNDKGSYYERLITEITDQFEFEDFNNKRLDAIFLQGFSSQTMELRRKNNAEDSKEEENES